MDFGLKGKKVLVTGGSHGIGLSIAKFLGQEGCQVAICSRTKIRVDKAINELKSLRVDAFGTLFDAAKKNDIERVVSEINKKWGGIDILINNVGGGGRWGSEDVINTPYDVWQEVYDKNTTAAIRFMQAFLPGMKVKKWGKLSCSLCCRAVCNTKYFFESQNPRFVIVSGFKSRAGYNAVCTVKM